MVFHIRVIFSTFVFLWVACACTQPHQSEISRNIAADGREAVCESAIREYTQKVHPVMLQQCSGCHDGSHYLAPDHTMPDSKISYVRSKRYLNLSLSAPEMKLVKMAENKHCLENDGKSGCGAKIGEFAAVAEKWIGIEKTCLQQNKVGVSPERQGKPEVRIENEKTQINEMKRTYRVKQMATGRGHACVLFEGSDSRGENISGKAKCWGNNRKGQLGVGSFDSYGTTTGSIATLPYVMVSEKIAQLSAGGSHTCALLEGKNANGEDVTGRVKCWGAYRSDDEYNFRTRQYESPKVIGSTPEEMKNIPYINLPGKAKKIFSQSNQACAILENKKLKCWGAHMLSPDNSNRYIYRGLVSEDIVDVSLGSGHFCFVMEGKGFFGSDVSGRAKCFGENRSGQLGVGDYQTHDGADARGFSKVLIPEKMTQIAAADSFTCALLEGTNKAGEDVTGKVKCWGGRYHNIPEKRYDRVKDDLKIDMESLEYLKIEEKIQQISLGRSFGCALLDGKDRQGNDVAGKIKCWGANDARQLGVPAERREKEFYYDRQESYKFEFVRMRERAKKIVAGDDFVCAILSGTNKLKQNVDGQIKCWGSNDSGQLGGDTDVRASNFEEQLRGVDIENPIPMIDFSL